MSFTNLTPVNAAPDVYMYGVNDKSARTPDYEMPQDPINKPLIFGMFQDGPTDKTLSVTGSLANRIYGAESFNLQGKFALHPTVMARMFFAEGNTCCIKRLRPGDAPPPANLRLYADVCHVAEDDEWERDPIDGSLKYEADGVTPKLTGNKIATTHIKFITEYVKPENPDDEYNTNIGTGKKVPGTYDVDGTVSEKIPLLDIEAPFFGSIGNLRGLRIWSNSAKGNRPFNTNLVEQGVYPFNIAFVQKANEHATPRQIYNNNGEMYTELCLKPDFIDVNTEVPKYIGTELLDAYRNLHPRQHEFWNYGPFGNLFVYQENIDGLLKILFDQERTHDYVGNDLKDVADDTIYLVNLFGLLNSNGSAYQSIRPSKSVTGSARMSENSAHFATGGGDGTINNTMLDDLVYQELLDFTDENSPWQDWVSNSFTTFFDSGYSIKVKSVMGGIIALRKDTVVYMATHVDKARVLTGSEESSLGGALRVKLAAYPESEFFGTRAFRGVVHLYSGYLDDDAKTWRRPYTALYSLARKISRLAGAGNGKFRAQHMFDRPPKNFVDELIDLNVTWKPTHVRNRDWANGLLYVEKITERQWYYSATRGIFLDDTSVLTSVITGLVVSRVQRVAMRAHKYHSGRLATREELKQAVEEFVRKELSGAFGEQYIINPNVEYTALDEKNGYSWTLRIGIGAKSMKTVQQVIVETQRYEDFEQTAQSFVA